MECAPKTVSQLRWEMKEKGNKNARVTSRWNWVDLSRDESGSGIRPEIERVQHSHPPDSQAYGLNHLNISIENLVAGTQFSRK